MTNEECRAEALRRVALSDALFDEYAKIPVAERHEGHPLFDRVCHARQTAAVYAALAAAPEETR